MGTARRDVAPVYGLRRNGPCGRRGSTRVFKMNCPYCDGDSVRDIGWYFNCDNEHTFHIDDWNADELREGTTV